jgi:mRNA interferase MazF
LKALKWEIYKANLDPILGSEQGNARPVIIISENYSNDILPVVSVLPITTRKANRNIYPTETILKAHHYGLPLESIVLCHQIRTIDKRKLTVFIGNLDDINKQNEVIDSLKFHLGL